MKRRSFYLLLLILLGGFYALTLFHSISVGKISSKDSLVPIEGEAVVIIGRNGALEFEESDVYFLGPRKTGFFAESAPTQDRMPLWMPGSYKRKFDWGEAFQLQTTRGIRIPMWPILALLIIGLLAGGKKKRK